MYQLAKTGLPMDGRSKEIEYKAYLENKVLCPECSQTMFFLMGTKRIKCVNEDCKLKNFEFEQPSVNLKVVYRYG